MPQGMATAIEATAVSSGSVTPPTSAAPPDTLPRQHLRPAPLDPRADQADRAIRLQPHAVRGFAPRPTETVATAPACPRPCASAPSTATGTSCPCQTGRDRRSTRDADHRSVPRFLRTRPSDLRYGLALFHKTRPHARPTREPARFSSDTTR